MALGSRLSRGVRAVKFTLTGGRGRIGRAIAAAALARGDSVVSIDRLAPPEVPEDSRFTFQRLADRTGGNRSGRRALSAA
jgi:nucleoside-diphosphate-sugar epimerase